MDDKISLKNDSFEFQVLCSRRALFVERNFTDVTLVSDDLTQFRAHRAVLAEASSALKNLLQMSQDQSSSLLFLRGINKEILEAILQFIYLGETVIENDTLNQFNTIANELKIQVLCNMMEQEATVIEPDDKDKTENISVSNHEDKDLCNGQAEENLKKDEVQENNLSTETKISPIKDCPKSRIRPVEEPVECDICAKVFTTRRSLLRHNRSVHELERHPCDQCSKDFPGKGNLRIHKIHVHEKLTPYSCTKCGVSYKTKAMLKHHHEKMHPDPKCKFCQTSFPDMSAFDLHIREEHLPNLDINKLLSPVL